MYPYHMREAEEPHKETLEITTAVVAALILIACAVSGVPRRSPTTSAGQITKEREPKGSSVTEAQAGLHQLQIRNTALEADVVKIARLLEDARSELARLKEDHNTLGTQVAATVTRLQQLETTFQQASDRVAKSGESATVRKIAKERDEALAQVKQSDDQVRQLTLKLQKAGVFP